MSNNPPAVYPDNPFTRLLERAAERTGPREVPVEAGASPSARSAAMGRVSPPPLSPAEKAELDALAIEAGIMPPEDREQGAFGSLDEALAVGSPVPRTVSTRSLAMPPEPAAPMVRLPDFKKIGGIDLFRNIVYIDSMEFPISTEDADGFKQYAIEIAREYLTSQLTLALAGLSRASAPPEQEETDSENVLPVRGEETTE